VVSASQQQQLSGGNIVCVQASERVVYESSFFGWLRLSFGAFSVWSVMSNINKKVGMEWVAKALAFSTSLYWPIQPYGKGHGRI
jgi:hypothetical protein